jgi:hypothetical protein
MGNFDQFPSIKIETDSADLPTLGLIKDPQRDFEGVHFL